ncbi:MAG: tyrosine--tRNA ligase, partial [Bdellovibrionales bacterium]|nr:tyrosine--tRNA ligase [Bdellovibrionales bacterium]
IQGTAYGFSTPLILDSQGRKFGKSEGGAIWLDPSLTSPYKLHQYLLNVEDKNVIHYLKIFTFLSVEEISRLENETLTNPEKRSAQKVLADQICCLVHGEQATADAKRCAEVLFGGTLEGLTATQLEEIFCDAPSSSMTRDQIATSTVLDLFVLSGLAKSRGEGKKLISSGGAYVNNNRIADAGELLANLKLDNLEIIVLRSGKKNYHLVRITG